MRPSLSPTTESCEGRGQSNGEKKRILSSSWPSCCPRRISKTQTYIEQKLNKSRLQYQTLIQVPNDRIYHCEFPRHQKHISLSLRCAHSIKFKLSNFHDFPWFYIPPNCLQLNLNTSNIPKKTQTYIEQKLKKTIRWNMCHLQFQTLSPRLLSAKWQNQAIKIPSPSDRNLTMRTLDKASKSQISNHSTFHETVFNLISTLSTQA